MTTCRPVSRSQIQNHHTTPPVCLAPFETTPANPSHSDPQQLFRATVQQPQRRRHSSSNRRHFLHGRDLRIRAYLNEINDQSLTLLQTQDFRPTPGLPNQIYRFNESSGMSSPLYLIPPLTSFVPGLVSIVADGFSMPNGICFSPDDRTAYVADTGLVMKDRDPTRPATMYVFPFSTTGVVSDVGFLQLCV